MGKGLDWRHQLLLTSYTNLWLLLQPREKSPKLLTIQNWGLLCTSLKCQEKCSGYTHTHTPHKFQNRQKIKHPWGKGTYKRNLWMASQASGADTLQGCSTPWDRLPHKLLWLQLGEVNSFGQTELCCQRGLKTAAFSLFFFERRHYKRKRFCF